MRVETTVPRFSGLLKELIKLSIMTRLKGGSLAAMGLRGRSYIQSCGMHDCIYRYIVSSRGISSRLLLP
jgi:predicted membrane-bound spermidine synthase